MRILCKSTEEKIDYTIAVPADNAVKMLPLIEYSLIAPYYSVHRAVYTVINQ